MVRHLTRLPAAQREILETIDLRQIDVFDAEHIRDIRFDAEGRPIRRQTSLERAPLPGEIEPDLFDRLRAAHEHLMAVQKDAADETAAVEGCGRIERLNVLIAARSNYQRLVDALSITPGLENLKGIRAKLAEEQLFGRGAEN